MHGSDGGRRDRDTFPADEYADLRRRLVRAVERRCPRWLSQQREDIVQVALMRLMQIDRGERTTPLPSSYLWKVAYSATIDEIRRLRRAQFVSLDGDGPVEPQAADSGSNPERARHGREIGHGIRDCLSRLAVDRRRAVTLHLVGHSVVEIVGLMGWNLKRAENLVYRGLDDLRGCLRGKGLEPTVEAR